TDNGFSWQKNFVAPISIDDYHLSGNSAKGCQDYFAGTVVEGVLRSTDKGQTWRSIGGPPSALDSRLLTALDDSLVYIVDTTGSIWVTDTKGRSSQPIITGDLQLRATEFPPCDTSAEIFIQLAQNVCTSTNITAVNIVGANASDYTITKLPSSPLALPDSIGIGFTPSTSGDIDATLVMSFSDGTRYTIDLGTKVKNRPTLSFADLEFTNITTDTIGGDAALHILSQGTGVSADAEFTIHYDTTYLIYRGVFDSTGRDLTIGHPTPTSARIRMNNLTDSSLFALFSFFPVDSACTKVYIDSLTEAPGKTKCLTLITSPVEALICFDPASICGGQTLSKFVKNGVFPTLFVTPNPSSGNVALSSDREIQNAVVDIIDMSGAMRERISLEKLSPTGYILSSSYLPNGVYEARVTGEGYVGTVRFVIVK
ncbi:MAG TPA: T9SS type A sorting domain-containing protein, partial [Candidatus Kapabacteria bacterium]